MSAEFELQIAVDDVRRLAVLYEQEAQRCHARARGYLAERLEPGLAMGIQLGAMGDVWRMKARGLLEVLRRAGFPSDQGGSDPKEEGGK
jgi:hypothetical protein